MDKNTFTYEYSANKNKEVERIRSKYLPREVSKMELLKSLDFKAQTAGQLESLVIGIIGALIFGLGLCFWLGALVGGWIPGVICSAIGVAVMIPAYPIYLYRSKSVKEELTPEILRLSDEIMKS